MSPAAHALPPQTCAPAITSVLTGPVALSGNCTITAYGGVVTSADTAITNSVSAGTLSNSGIVSAYDTGIYNAPAGTIASLLNSGVINGHNDSAIYNEGLISSLTNSGTISGYETGIDNSGTIGALTNTGLISSIDDEGIDNEGTIGGLTNSGVISGYSSGIDNNGVIGALTNSGVINSLDDYGIDNEGGTIAALTNSGTISGYASGIDNYEGTITGALTNSGLILSQDDEGIDNENGIIGGALINSGVISAPDDTGIYNYEGTIGGGLTNSGTITAYDEAVYNEDGIIAGDLNNSGTMASTDDYAIDNHNGTIGGALINSGLISAAADTAIYNYEGIIDGGLTNSGVITAYDEAIDNSNGYIGGAVSNTGTIRSNYDTAIYNYEGTIAGGLSNSGLISAPDDYGIYNDSGTIAGAVTNSGTITSYDSAIENDDGVIGGGLTNSGVINSTDDEGIDNDSGLIVGDLINTGKITAYDSAVDNDTGTITGALTNSGQIISTDDEGIDNDSGIIGGSLTNAGLISAYDSGIDNYDGIIGGGLTNSGTITGLFDSAIDNGGDGTISGALTNSGVIAGLDDDGIYNSGTIGGLVNSGSISGYTTAIYSTGGNFGNVTNTGIISGDVDVYDQNLTITGASGQKFGTLSGGDVNLSDGDTLTFAAGNEELSDNVTFIEEGSGLVQNNATLRIGNVYTTPAVTIYGDFTQAANGTLVVPVTPIASSVLNVTGTATLAGNVTYQFAPGTYKAATYDYLNSPNAFAGSFTSASYETALGTPLSGLPASTVYGDPQADLVLGAGFVVNAPDVSLFSDQKQALAEDAQNSTGELLDAATAGETGNSAACQAEEKAAPANTALQGNAVSATARLASTLGNVFCGAGGWVEATGSYLSVDASDGAGGYHADGGGFLAGLDKVLGQIGTRLGIAVGYDQLSLSDSTGGSGSMGVTRVALYAVQPLGPVSLTGVISYANAGNSTSRASGIGNLSAKNNSNIFSGGAEVSGDVNLGPIVVEPAGGVKIAGVDGGDFTENASGIDSAYAVSGRVPYYTSIQPFVRATFKDSFTTQSDVVISADGSVGFEYEAGDRSVDAAYVTADDTALTSPANKLDPSTALLSASLSAGKGNWSVYGKYGAQISGNWSAQTGEVGVRFVF